MSGKTPLVAIVVLNWNNWRDSVECLESLGRITYPRSWVLLVDNGSTDNSEQILRTRFPQLEILQTGANRGYAGGNNCGLRRGLEGGADYLGVVNNDVVVEPDFLEPLVAALQADPALGIVGGLQCSYHDPRIIQPTGSYFNRYTGIVRTDCPGEVEPGQCHRPKPVDFISGCAFLARAEMVEAIGLLDESFFLLGEEVDWCLRAQQAGWGVGYVPGSKILHKGSATLRSRPALYTYYGLRNRLWLLRRYSSSGQYLLFLLLFSLYFCPKMLVGRLLKGEAHLLGPLLRGLCDGFAPMHPAIPAGRESRGGVPMVSSVE